MLILFDIDGTILRSMGIGLEAMGQACSALFGRELAFDGVEVAGRLDPLIWNDLLAMNGVTGDDELAARFRRMYSARLASHLDDGAPVRVMPGIEPLLDRLDEHAGVTLGLLTGNFEETGRLKIRHAGIDDTRFSVCAWGSDGMTRSDLPAVALRRFEDLHGRAMEPDRTIVIGDTPHDVTCAHDNGCRCIAVATGMFGMERLTPCGADLTVEDLSDTEAVFDWILTHE